MYRDQAIQDLIKAVPHSEPALRAYVEDKENKCLNSVFTYAIEQRTRVLELEAKEKEVRDASIYLRTLIKPLVDESKTLSAKIGQLDRRMESCDELIFNPEDPDEHETRC